MIIQESGATISGEFLRQAIVSYRNVRSKSMGDTPLKYRTIFRECGATDLGNPVMRVGSQNSIKRLCKNPDMSKYA